MTWKDYLSDKPERGTRFVYVHDDGLSCGMAKMTFNGPVECETGAFIAEPWPGWWKGAMWAPLPDDYELSFEAPE